MVADFGGPTRLLSVFFVLCAFVALACQFSVTAPADESAESAEVVPPVATPLSEADEELVLKSFLQETDLPAGWFQDYFGVDEWDGDAVFVKDFRPTDKLELDYVVVTHRIILYGNESAVKEAFGEKWEQSVASVDMGQPPTEIDFASNADGSMIGCLYSTTALQPENFCGAVARYGRLISILNAKTWDEDVEERWFTWADFEQALKAMDRRALDAQGR